MQFFNAVVLLVGILLYISNVCFGQIKSDAGNTTDLTVNPSSFFLESFESHIPSDDPLSQPFNLSGDNHATISTKNVLEGSRSILSFIPLSPTVRDPRSELRHKGGTGAPNSVDWQHQPFTTRTFLFSCYFPLDMVFDPVEEKIMQWKNQRDPDCDVGDPPFSIRVSDNDIKYSIKYDSAACTTATKTVFGNINTSLTRGVWHHFVIEIHYDYRITNTNGHVKIWYSENDPVTNADSVLNYQGPIGYNDQLWPYFKVGVYKSEWRTKENRDISANAGVTERKMWIDQVGITEGTWQNKPINRPVLKKKISCANLKLTAKLTNESCKGNDGTIDLKVTGGKSPYTYIWSHHTKGARASLSNLSAGNYQVTVTDNQGCVVSKWFTINTQPGPLKPVITEDGEFLYVEATNGIEYEWYINGSLIKHANDHKLQITESGDYSVVVIDANECFAASDVYSVTITSTSEYNSIIQDLEIYPVPTTTELNINLKLSQTANVRYEIFSTDGNLEIQKKLDGPSRSSSFNIDVSSLPSGIHLIILKVLNEIVTRRFIKQ